VLCGIAAVTHFTGELHRLSVMQTWAFMGTADSDVPACCLAQSGPVLFHAAATSRNATQSGNCPANQTSVAVGRQSAGRAPQRPLLRREADAAGRKREPG
jgi:hypothetical protein